MPKASIILATFDWPDALAMVLSALTLQTEKDFEVLIADDGSDQKTKSVIDKYCANVHFPLEHFWQEHKGFRKSRILNQAVVAAKGETLIFLDGDCIPHKEFVAEHIRIQEKGFYIAGRRLDLSKEFTESLSAAKVGRGVLNGNTLNDSLALWQDSRRTKSPMHRGLVIRSSWLRKLMGLEKVLDLKGCNFSVAHADMLAICGFDEAYEGYGREDTDVELRLQNLGLKIKSGKNLCLQFHLWHPPRSFTAQNESLLNDVKRTKRIKALKGIGA